MKIAGVPAIRHPFFKVYLVGGSTNGTGNKSTGRKPVKTGP